MTDEGSALRWPGGFRSSLMVSVLSWRMCLRTLNKSAAESAVAVPRYNKDHKVQNLLAYVIL